MKNTGAAHGGFTLIEMTVVVVIAALLIGSGVLVYNIIHSAKLRATIAQIEMFDSSYNAFRLKYACLPGDCVNAEALGFEGSITIDLVQNQEPASFLLHVLNPIADAYAARMIENAQSPIASPPVQTFFPISGSLQGIQLFVDFIDGNGDGRLNGVESPISFSMLFQANMLTGFEPSSSKLPLVMPSKANIAPGVQRPGLWFVGFLTPVSNGNDPTIIETAKHYYLTLGALEEGWPAASVLTPANAHNIDLKIDDGVALSYKNGRWMSSGRIGASSDPTIDLEHGPRNNPDTHMGAEGSDSDYCVTTNGRYNFTNLKELCTLAVSANI